MTTFKPYSPAMLADMARAPKRFKRGDQAAVMVAAARQARESGSARYVFGTMNGLVISAAAPPATQGHYEMTADGFRKV